MHPLEQSNGGTNLAYDNQIEGARTFVLSDTGVGSVDWVVFRFEFWTENSLFGAMSNEVSFEVSQAPGNYPNLSSNCLIKTVFAQRA